MSKIMQQLVTTYDKKEKIWRGPSETNLFNEEMSVGEVALHMLRSKNPQDIMQISDSEGTSMTYGTVLSKAIRLAQHFQKMKLSANDVVAIFAPNVLDTTPVVVAAWFNGTPFHATNCTFDLHLVKHIYSFVQPKIIFCDGEHYEKVKQASQEFRPLIYTLCNHLERVPKMEELLEPIMAEHLYRAQPLTYGPEQTIAIMLSSGTCGLPKGVCISNRSCTMKITYSNGSSNIFSPSTLDWYTGLFTLMTNVLVGGIRIVTTKPITPEYLLELIIKYKINLLITIPTFMIQVSLLPEYTPENMQSIRMLLLGGSFCSESNLKRIRSALTKGVLGFTYGNSEFGGVSTNFSNYKGNSVGKIVANVQLKIVDTKTGERLGPKQTGEICVSSGNKWSGYYKNPEATSQAIDADNFIHTGDMGYMDDEHYLYYTGRSKEILKYMGFQYSPQVIEDIIVKIPDVIDVCVFGVFDDVKFDVPAAAIVKKDGSSLSAQDVMEYVRSKTKMAHNQIHYGVFFLQKLPRNNNGKLLRNEIKEICLAMEESKSKSSL